LLSNYPNAASVAILTFGKSTMPSCGIRGESLSLPRQPQNHRKMDKDNKGNIVLYQPNGIIQLEVRLENETVWLTQMQMAQLFGRDKSVISRHISNIYKEQELDAPATVANFATVQEENGRQVERHIDYYNLDVIISVGYRVKSKQGTLFR
jgi:hypothetical protein